MYIHIYLYIYIYTRNIIQLFQTEWGQYPRTRMLVQLPVPHENCRFRIHKMGDLDVTLTDMDGQDRYLHMGSCQDQGAVLGPERPKP